MPKLIAACLALLVITEFANAQANPQEALAKDIAAIQGTWQVTAAEEGGEQLPAGLIADLKHVFDGDHSLTMIVGEKQKPAAYTLDPSTSPKSIDIIQQHKNKTEQGIYELEGDTLRICLAKDSEPRPTKFESKSATQRFGLATFKRVAEKKAAAPPAQYEKKSDAKDTTSAKPSHWGVRLCGWKDDRGQAVYMFVPEKYVSYDFDDLKNGKGDNAKFWEGDDQKRWKGLLHGEAALLKALGEFPQGETVRVEDFVDDYAVTDPKVLEQVKATAKAAGLKLELDEERAAKTAKEQLPK